MRRRLLEGMMLCFAMGGCSAWPTHAHLPDRTDTIPADVDPGDDVRAAIAWQSWIQHEPDEQPTGTPAYTLTELSGAVVEGAIEGSGWFDQGVPEQLTDDTCGSSGTRAADAGDYVGDVDTLLFRVQGPGRLCARLQLGDATHGVDLLLARLDTCGVPTDFIENDEASPLGLGRAGGEITWSTPLEVDQPLAAMIAVYQPNDGELSLPYRLQLSLVPQNAPCPSPAQNEDSP